MSSRLVRIRESFWFLPAVLTVLAALLAEVLVSLDARVTWSLGPLDFLIYRVGEDGSRDVLGVIAGTSMAVASTSFSITIAVLALASSSYGPRLVRNFMADRGNQTVLGVYVATFLYCLLVLRSIRVTGDGGGAFVPQMAVNVAVLFAVANVGVLIFFVHHISESIQVWTLTARVRSELRAVVERLYPDTQQEPSRPLSRVSEQAASGEPTQAGTPVTAEKPGYVLGIDIDHLVRAASRADAVLRLALRPGDYVVDGEPLATVHPASATDDELVGAVRSAMMLGSARSPHQDVGFAVQQLVEMAVRALSPGTNDPWTAINAIDELSSGLVLLARRPQPAAEIADDEGVLRLVAPSATAIEVLDQAADSLRRYAMGAPSVVHRTLELLGRVGAAARDDDLRLRALHHVELISSAFATASPSGSDVVGVTEAADAVRRQLARGGVGATPRQPLP